MNDYIAYQTWKSDDRLLALAAERRRNDTESLERRRIDKVARRKAEQVLELLEHELLDAPEHSRQEAATTCATPQTTPASAAAAR